MSGYVNPLIGESLTQALDRHRFQCVDCRNGGCCEVAEALINRLVDRMIAIPMMPRGQA